MRYSFIFYALLLLSIPLRAGAAEAPATVTYSQVRAVFVKHCISCHDAKEAEGKLVMESYELLMKGGEDGAAIIPGKADQSSLVQQIEHKTKPFMPPKKAKDTLAPEEIATIRRWIDQGAPGPAPGEVLSPVAPLVVIPKIEPKGVPRKPVRAIVWSPQAKLAAIARDAQIELMSVDDQTVIRVLRVDKGNINALAFSADGTKLATGAGEAGTAGEIDLWNVADGTRIKQLVAHSDAVYSLALSTDGKTLASGSYDNKILLWDVNSGKLIRTLDGHNGAVLGLAFRPDGKVLASVSADRTVKLWDAGSGARLDTFAESLKELNAVRFSPDGQRLIAAGYDNRIRVWQISPTAKEGTNRLLVAQFGHQGAILALGLSADGKTLASTADDRTVKVWNSLPTSVSGSPELKMLRVLPAQPDWPAAIAFAADDKVLIVGRLDGTVGFYNAKTADEIPAPKPELVGIEPRGIQSGTTITLSLKGKHLSGLKGASFNDHKLTAKVMSDGGSLEVACAPDLAPGPYDIRVMTAGGESGVVKLFVDDLSQAAEKEPNDSPELGTEISLPTDVWGTFDHRGDIDHFAFVGKAGQTIVFDVATDRLGSQAKVFLELLSPGGTLLASSNGFEGSTEPLLAYKLAADGRYIIRLTELEAAASDMHFYRLSAGSFAFVTGCYPLAVAPSSEGKVRWLGKNLSSDAWATVKSDAGGEADVPLDRSKYRSRKAMKVLIGTGAEPVEVEPNDTPDHATPLAMPGSINGRIDKGGDVDLFRFEAKAGQTYMVETLASRRGSPVDTKIEILHPDGSPVPRIQLRAVRDSAINFRGFDANAMGGRLNNWQEMDLNQYLYLSGEVVRLVQAPRGPDSEFGFYTIANKRQCYFDTTATAHALDEPCYIVEPHKPGETFAPNGLPVFTINYANDDDSDRKLGSDSRLSFTAPADGAYLVRVTDARGWGGDHYVYRLTVHPAAPDFNVTINLKDPEIPPGAGKNFAVNLDRGDGYEGPVRVDIAGAPPGFIISTPLVVEAGHTVALGTIFAAADAPAPTTANEMQTKVTATANLSGQEVIKTITGFGKISLAKPPMLYLGLGPAGTGTTKPAADPTLPPEITIAPGEFIPARLWVKRNGFDKELTFEADNLPHGVIIADIGLSGVFIPPDQPERQIFLHTAPWVADQDRLCYVRAKQAGAPTSMPILIHVRNHTAASAHE
jgi:WD40 repeat protein/mono/diheme cytochrome c family protein